MAAEPPTDSGDQPSARYRELLEELRTIIPGVQVLFAFLLTVPFSARFTEVDRLGRDVFAAALVGVALAIVVFLTPAAFHRVGSGGDREVRLRVGVRLTLVGMALLAVSVPAVLFVVARFVFDHGVLGVAVAGVTAGTAVGLWFVLPFLTNRR